MAAVLPPRDMMIPDTRPAAAPAQAAPQTKARYAWAIARVSLGWVFLWAFVDKLFGLGYATERADAWINGGSPTFGFLNFGANGPLAGFYQSFAGAAWADWLFMIGMLGIGLALMLGVAMRIAAAAGALMMVLMYSAAPVLENNPLMDDHLVYAIVLVGLALAGAGRTWGLGRQWESTTLVKRYPILK